MHHLLRHTRPLYAALLGAALLLSACGGDSSPTAATEGDAPRDVSRGDDEGNPTGADGAGSDRPSTIAPGEPYPDAALATAAALVERLRGLGIRATYEGEALEQSFFLPAAQLLTVEGQEVRAFLYDSAAALKADAAKISPDAGMLDGTPVRWMAAPRFYASGTVIVLYVGVEASVIRALDTLFGPPFAGQDATQLDVSDPGDPGSGRAEIAEPALIVAGTDEELERLRPYLTQEQAARLAGIDLANDVAVAVFRGAMPTAGYAIDIETVAVDAADLVVVTVGLRNPGIDELVAQVVTYPADVRVVPRAAVADPAQTAWVARTQDGQLLARFFAGVTSPGNGGVVPPPVNGRDEPLPIEPDGWIGGLGDEPIPVEPDGGIGDSHDTPAWPNIAGTIAESQVYDKANAAGVLARVLVQGTGRSGYDVAWVEVLSSTAIAFDGETFAPPTLADLAPGRQVEVVFAGPVRESFPVQAVARQIVIAR